MHNRLPRVLVIVAFFALHPLRAQKQYWGVAEGAGSNATDPYRYGGIFRVDEGAMHPEQVVPFDTGQYLGRMASGSELLAASNGRLYGITYTTNSPPMKGDLFWIDPVTDSVHIAVRFGSSQYPVFDQPPLWSSLMELRPGVLIGHTGTNTARATLFKFFTANDSIVQMAQFPSTLCGDGRSANTSLQGTLIRGSDGYVYGVSPLHRCKAQQVVRIDADNGSISYFDVQTNDGYPLNGDKIIERNGKIYFSAFRGGPDEDQDIAGKGTVISFDMASHAIVKERDYTTDLHNPWNGWTIGADGRWYGEVAGEPWVPFQEIDQTQALYAYDPQQNTLDELVDYGDHPGREVIGARVLGGLLGATNGRIYGSFRNGLFEYDPVADTLLLKAALQFEADDQVSGHGATGSLVEVCRKPNYRPTATTQFQVCAGARFFYDLRNVNATSVVWRRNGIVDPAQADQQLTFDAIAGADEGTWTCTLANECGTTQPPPINITVTPGSFTAGSITGDTLLCGNGDTALLTGNNGGTWSTGAISSTVGVNAPGAYYVRYQQACGLSFSNAVHVAHLDSAQAPPITDGSGQRFHEDLFMCPGQTAIFKNNVEGPWGLHTPGIWSNGTAAGTTAAITAVQDSGQYHVTVSNACNTDTSGSWHVRFFPPPPSPHLVFTDADGLPADASFCTGGSVFLNITVTNSNEPWLSTGWTFPDGTFILGPHSIAATATGVYGLRVASCNVIDTAFTITLDSVLPDPPVILPDQDELIGCDQDTAYLTTLSPGSYWAWRDAQNVMHVDTVQQVQVDWHAGISGLYSLYAYNGCGTSQPDLIQVVGLPAPEVSYVETHDIVCLDAAPFPLTAGSPPGGSYSGPGVSGAVLDPAAAGLGTHTIVYAVDDGTCIGRASATVSVQICTGIAEPEDAGVRIVPLPLHDRSFVWSARDPILSYRLLDAVGRTVRDGRVGANELELERDGLPAGSYLLQLRCAQRTIVRRIVVD